MKPKVIANYLPQFHVIPENSLWWGDNYTEWVAVKNATPLYDGHIQPKVPLKSYYYDLADTQALIWQAQLANKYGIDGFGIYHYWFNEDMCLLDKPVINLNENKNIQIDYFLIWDNSSWVRTWSNVKAFSNDWTSTYENNCHSSDSNGVLAKLSYGGEREWKIHFQYLRRFLVDERYIKIDNRPVFCFFNQDNQPDVINEMCKCWDALARDMGFSGMLFIGKKNTSNIKICEREFFYEPEWSVRKAHNTRDKITNSLKKIYHRKSGIVLKYDYDGAWKKIIGNAMKNDKNDVLFGGFVSYDDTPRRGKRGTVIEGATPEKFESYFRRLYELSTLKHKELIFLTAWNEWGEGAYLEPDVDNGYGYLDAIRNVVNTI